MKRKIFIITFFFTLTNMGFTRQEPLLESLSGDRIISVFKVDVHDFPTLTWTALTQPVTGYYIFRSTNETGPWLKLNRKPINKIKYIDSAAKPEIPYFYTISAVLTQNKQDKILGLSNTGTGKISPYSSGLVLGSTAYRERNFYRGLNVDFLISYYIGHLYGENRWGDGKIVDIVTPIGMFFFTSDIKFVLENGSDFPLAWAAGYKYTAVFAGQKFAPGQRIGIEFKLGQGANFNSGYLVVGKNIFRTSLHCGILLGKEQKIMQLLSDVLRNHPGWQETEYSFYAIIDSRLIPGLRLKFEFVRGLGNPLDPWLIHTNLGQILKTNFDITFLKHNEGYNIIGGFWFRFTFYPRTT